MFEFFNNVLKAWRDSSPGQRSGLVIFLLLVVVGVGIYEKQTATFRLTKLERAAQIIHSMPATSPADTNAIAEISHSIISQLKDIVSPSSAMAIRHSLFSRFRYGLMFWIVIGLLFIPSAIRKGREEIKAAYGAWAFGTIVSAIAMFLPDILWPWFHIVVYPILSLVILVGFLAVVGSAIGKKDTTNR